MCTDEVEPIAQMTSAENPTRLFHWTVFKHSQSPTASASLSDLMSLCLPGLKRHHHDHSPSHEPVIKSKQKNDKPVIVDNRHNEDDTLFPPLGYRPTPINTLLANALDLTAPASDALLKNRKNAWVQLAGHPGSFAPAGPHTIWKKRLTKENNETVAYQALMNDEVRSIVPRFYREVEYNVDFFIEIEDLLQHFHNPNIMDIKMGTRTFLELEVKNPVLRKDLYEKMMKLDPSEPSEEEHENRAITKLRYMQFREKGSTTATLGFRIEAIRMSGEPANKELKKIKTKEQVKATICRFLNHDEKIQDGLIVRLKQMKETFESSQYFKSHEIIGSSILVMHDHNHKVNAWMIDFAKTLQVSEDLCPLSHSVPWVVGNHEDGYVTGLSNLIEVISEIQCEEREECERNFERPPSDSEQRDSIENEKT